MIRFPPAQNINPTTMMMISRATPSLGLAVLTLAVWMQKSHAFVASPDFSSRSRLAFRLAYSPSSGGHASSPKKDVKDVESARQSFESLFSQTPSKLTENRDNGNPLLTTAGRRLRELEMDLIESLQDTDEAINELMHLWMSEHGSEAAVDLMAMQEHCSDGLLMEQARLLEMIHDFPHWAEPHVRMATLLYYKGETEAARQLVNRALEMKPWHFEAMQLMVLVSLREGNMSEAIVWARKSLPGRCEGSRNRRRHEWVKRSLAQAQDQFVQGERATLDRFQSDAPDQGTWQ